MIHRKTTLALLFFCSLATFGQSDLIDSLRNQLKVASTIEEKVFLHDEIGYQLSSRKPLISVSHADSAIRLANEIEDPKLLLKAYNGKSIPLIRLGRFTEAKYVLDSAYKFSVRTVDLRSTASILSKMGVVAQEQNDLKNAQKYYLESLEIFEELQDSLAIAQTYDNLAAIFERLDDFERSLLYNKKSLPILEAYDYA